MQRILIIGSGGAGKSTFAKALGAETGLPVVHLDAYHWRAGWIAMPTAEWTRTIEELAARPAWIMDGNYGGTLDQRLDACDTVIFLDLPRMICLWRALGRWVRYRGRSRPDMAAGCPERMTLEFCRWIWAYPRVHRPDILRRLSALPRSKRVVILESPRAVARFLRKARGPD